MSLVDVGRRIVLRTNHWRGLKTLYVRAYDLGLAFTARRLSSVPGVLAVLLRADADGRKWVPGQSDYDLTVVTDRHDTRDTLPFLDALWRRYRSIKKVVPQLGEMEVMDVDGYGDFLDFGPARTASLKRAYPLFVKPGDPALESLVQRPPRPSDAPEFLLDALSRMGQFAVPAWLDHVRAGNSATLQRVEHRLGNIAKRLARAGAPVAMHAADTVADRMVMVFQAMTHACRVMTLPRGGPAVAIDPEVAKIPAETITTLRSIADRVLSDARIGCGSAIAWTSYMSVDRLNLAFILPDDARGEELKSLLKAMSAPSRVPLFAASESMWNRWRELSSFDAIAVAATGRRLIGTGGDAHAVPLPALQRAAEVEYAGLLPLQNNWRQWPRRASGQSYAALVNYANGLASAFTDRVVTAPATLQFTSTEEGYQCGLDALKELRGRLRRA